MKLIELHILQSFPVTCLNRDDVGSPKYATFGGALNPRTHGKVIEFILRNAPTDFGCLAIASASNCQGYTMRRIGPEGKTGRRDVEISGNPPITEDWIVS